MLGHLSLGRALHDINEYMFDMASFSTWTSQLGTCTMWQQWVVCLTPRLFQCGHLNVGCAPCDINEYMFDAASF